MKKMKKRVAVSCYEFQIVGLEHSKRGLGGRPTVSTSLSALVVAKSSSTISSCSLSGAHGYGYRGESAWRGTSARGEKKYRCDERARWPISGGGTTEGSVTQGGTNAAAVYRADGTE